MSVTRDPSDPEEVFAATFTLPRSCTFGDGSAAVKGGPDDCSYPSVDGQTFTFIGNTRA